MSKVVSVSMVVMAVVISLAATSCGGSPTNGTPVPEPTDSFAATIQPIFDANCVRCHAPGIYGFGQTGGEDQNGLDLTPGSSHRSLVNQPTFQEPNDAPTLRVQPRSPDGSYLMQKIIAERPKSGERMPLFGPYLSDSDIQLIRDWIARGAPND